MKSIFRKYVLNVNAGPNPTPMSKLGKEHKNNTEIEISPKWGNYGGARNCPCCCPFLGRVAGTWWPQRLCALAAGGHVCGMGSAGDRRVPFPY